MSQGGAWIGRWERARRGKAHGLKRTLAPVSADLASAEVGGPSRTPCPSGGGRLQLWKADGGQELSGSRGCRGSVEMGPETGLSEHPPLKASRGPSV